MNYRITALQLDITEDLLPLSAVLQQRGVAHRIFEESGRQVVKVGSQDQVEEVVSLYRAWRSGEIRIERVAHASGARSGRGEPVASSGARLLRVPIAPVTIAPGHYEPESRFLLDAQVRRNGEVVGRADALNDVVVNSGTSAQMIELELSINDTFVYRQRADGLIISTPTGSTAYSLSGGGPIMHPSLDAVVLVPMYPHALSSRPIVVDGSSEIRIEVLERNRIHPPVTCDGQVNMTARPGDSVHITKEPDRLTLLHPLGHSFYASCRDKLRWSNALVN